jgi:hypothetical protein
MSTKTKRLKAQKSVASISALAGSILMLSGCNVASIERPHYSVTEIESFKKAGAPSRVMMLEVVDADNTFDNAFWTEAMSNHGYPPRLRFVSDPADIAEGETIKPDARMVAVVNPSQATMRAKLCTIPESVGMDETTDSVIVRFGFCDGDKILSETRAHFNREQLGQQIENNADTINYMLFPRHRRSNDDRYCSPFLPSC